MPIATRSGNVFHPPEARRARARGRYRGRGHFSVNTRSKSSSSREEASQSPSPVRTTLSDRMAFFSKDPFQHTDTSDREIEQGNHSRQRDVPKTDSEKSHDTDEEHEDFEDFCKDKRL